MMQKEPAMSNTTKRALENSLKQMLLKKPLDKITISDLTDDCGISRMAFYYHFCLFNHRRTLPHCC
jgi:AcrR family transcriptional regulator